MNVSSKSDAMSDVMASEGDEEEGEDEDKVAHAASLVTPGVNVNSGASVTGVACDGESSASVSDTLDQSTQSKEARVDEVTAISPIPRLNYLTESTGQQQQQQQLDSVLNDEETIDSTDSVSGVTVIQQALDTVEVISQPVVQSESSHQDEDKLRKVKHKPRLLRQAASVMYELSDRLIKRTSRDSSREGNNITDSPEPSNISSPKVTRKSRFTARFRKSSSEPSPTSVSSISLVNDTLTVDEEAVHQKSGHVEVRDETSSSSVSASIKQPLPARSSLKTTGPQSTLSACSSFTEDDSHPVSDCEIVHSSGKMSSSPVASGRLSSHTAKISKFSQSAGNSFNRSFISERNDRGSQSQPQSPISMRNRSNSSKVKIKVPETPLMMTVKSDSGASPKSHHRTVKVSTSNPNSKVSNCATLKIANVSVRKAHSMEGTPSPPSPSLVTSSSSRLNISPVTSSTLPLSKITPTTTSRLAASLTSVTNATSETMLAPIAEEDKNRLTNTIDDTITTDVDEYTSENIFGIHIHNINRKLKYTKPVLHPVVKVHVIDINTGTYLLKKNPKRNVVSHYEYMRTSSPIGVNASDGTTNMQINYILPIMTQPCDLVRYIRYPRAPIWEELLLYNEDYEHFLSNQVIVFFEILDFTSLDASFSSNSLSLSQLCCKTHWWHRVAWAYLRLVGSDGTLKVEKKLGLQLFKPVSSEVFERPSKKKSSPSYSTELFSWWSQDKKVPFPGSIFITVKAIPLTQSRVQCKPSLRSLLPFQEELGLSQLSTFLPNARSTGVIDSHQPKYTVDSSGNCPRNGYYKDTCDENITKWLDDSSVTVDDDTEHWWAHKSCKRLCKVPIIPWKEFSAGNNRSCYSLKFSNDGSKLACGASVFAAYLSAEKRSSVFIYELPSGTFFRRVNGFHLGTIYDIDWSYDDRLIMSASNDCTVQIWSVEKEKLSSVVLPHPCFIYSCKFCPTRENQYLIFTGAYDGLIRLWSVRKCFEVTPGLSKDPELMCEIDAFQGHILSLCFKLLPQSNVPLVAAEDEDDAGGGGLLTMSPNCCEAKVMQASSSSSSHQSPHRTINSRSSGSHHPSSPALGATRDQQSNQLTSVPCAPGDLVLFSAGSNGTITLWKQMKPVSSICNSSILFDASSVYAPYNWMAASQIRIPELKNVPINCIKASTIGSKMLVCSRDGLLRMIDYDLEMVVREYNGSQNFSHLIRGSLSPCGNFIFIGSDDGVVHVWDSDTGEAVHTFNELPFKGPVTCVEYHPYENLIAICGLGGRTVSVCLYRHSDLMQGEVQSSHQDRRSDNAVASSSPVDTVSPRVASPSVGRRVGRPILQKSITVDHPGSRGSSVTLRSVSSRRHGHRDETSGQTVDDQMFTDVSKNENCVEESAERSRMKRAIRKLETALKMRSLDHS